MRQVLRSRWMPFSGPALLFGLLLVALSGIVAAEARGGASTADRWIAIDEGYLTRFPAEVRAAIMTQARLCGPLAAVHPSFARYIHAGSGRDFISLHYDRFRCSDRRLICGRDGCLHQVFAPAGASYRLVFSTRVGDIELAVVGGRTTVRSECIASSTHHCAYVLLWNGHQLAVRP